jgi:hypothetical protein
MSDQISPALSPTRPERTRQAQLDPVTGSAKKQSKQSYYRRRRARMTPAQIAAFNAHAAELARARRKRNPERIRALDRAKYARRLARDPEGFRAKRRASQSYYENPGVEVELVF